RRSAGAWRTQVKKALLGLIVAIGLALLPVPLAAQAVTGTILGTVTDATGGVMPGATVTVKHEGTGVTRTIVTDSNGEFTAPGIPTGKYTLSAELSGFKTMSLSGIDVGVDQRVRINVKLEIGAVSENVTITGSSPLVQISSSELGTTVSE